MRFIARPNAATYPDADHNATTRPMTNAGPAAGVWLRAVNGPRRVEATEDAPASERMPSNAFTVFGSFPTSPSNDSSAMSAGNNESTA